MTQNEKIRELRKLGYKYESIAKKCGCSVSTVCRICGTNRHHKSKSVTPENCIYKNLRTWMNIHKITRSELCRRCCDASTSNEIYRIMKGKCNPSKHLIDKLIEVTGLSYELLFEVDENANE